MYKRIVLAFDNTIEGRRALREGVLLAKACEAEVFLLSVVVEGVGVTMAEGIQAGVAHRHREAYAAMLQDGLAKLREFGFEPAGKIAIGDPATHISQYANEVKADLVVVGHRRKSFIERWWSGPSGAYIVDNVDCSLLVAQSEIGDEAFERALAALARAKAGKAD